MAAVILLVAYLLLPDLLPPVVTGTTQLNRDNMPKIFGVGNGPPLALLTDGSRLYFTEISGSHAGLVQVSNDGGKVLPVETPFSLVGLSDISPTRPELLVEKGQTGPVRGDAPLWMMSVPGGQPRRIGDLMVWDAIMSPEGILWQRKADGTDRRQLTFPPLEVGLPRWSPDGTQIAFGGRQARQALDSLYGPNGGRRPCHTNIPDSDFEDPN